MLIVQIGPYPLSRERIRGGVEASVFGLAQEQSKTHEVHAFDIPRIGMQTVNELDGNVLVHRFCNTGRWQVSTARQVKDIAKLIFALQPDICHIHGTGPFSWKMYRQLKQNNIKTIVTVHGLVRVEKRNLLKKKFSLKRFFQFIYQGQVEKHFLSQIPEAIVDTEYVKTMVEKYPIRKKPTMHVIPQGINEEYFQICCSEDSNTLLSVGAIGERKGHLFTVEAFERVRQLGVDCKLLIAGSIARKEYYCILKKTIEESKFRNDIELLADVADNQLKQLYRDSHIFVLHTEEESQGIVFAEAMATGMPVVATRVGGVPCVVCNGDNGLLSGYGDVMVFAENIKKLIMDKNLWQSMSESAIKAANNYHWSYISEKIIKIYQKVDC